MKIGSFKLKVVICTALTGGLALSVISYADTATPATNAAAANADSERAQALLQRAVAHYKGTKNPQLTDFGSKGQFVDAELYVFVLSTDGMGLASGGPPSSSSLLIGRNVRDQEDPWGKHFFREILSKARAKDSGTVEYRWLNPVDNHIERKVAHFQKVGDRIIAVGHYVPRATPEQTKALLARAVAALRANPQAAIKAFNEPHSDYLEDDLYVFVIRLADKTFLADGADRMLIGTDSKLILDSTGQPLIEKMISSLAGGDEAELDYAWSNPITNKGEHKHTYLRKADDMLVGVGYYAR